MADDRIIDTIEGVISGYRRTLSYSVLPPKNMGHIKDHLKMNTGAILFATFLLLVARAFAGFSANALDEFAVNLGIAASSFFILYMVPTVVILFRKPEVPGDRQKETSPTELLVDRLSSIFIFIWTTSLTFFIVDRALSFLPGRYSFIGLAELTGNNPLSRVLEVSFCTVLAVAVLVIRSRLHAKFVGSDWRTTIISVLAFGALNIFMMYFFIFNAPMGHATEATGSSQHSRLVSWSQVT
jgi:hypothetical protein